MVGFRGPKLLCGLRGVKGCFYGVIGALLAPEKPASESGVFDQAARLRSGRRVLFKQIAEQVVEIFPAFARDDQFVGCAAMRGGVAADDFFTLRRDRSGLRMKFHFSEPRFGNLESTRVRAAYKD